MPNKRQMIWVNVTMLMVSVLIMSFAGIWFASKNPFVAIGGVLAITLVIFYGLLISHVHQESTSIKQKLIAFGIGLIMILLGIAIMIGLKLTAFTHLWKNSFNWVVFTTVVTPLMEETIFRQILYKELLSNIPKFGAVITIVLFAALHLPTTFATWLFYLNASTALFIAYHYSGDDIRVSSTLHILNNLISLI